MAPSDRIDGAPVGSAASVLPPIVLPVLPAQYRPSRHPGAIAARRRAAQQAVDDVADGLTVIDATTVLALVVVRRDDDGSIVVDASARGLSKPDAADVLRRVADRWAAPVA
jgi:hypothetical protein